MESAKLEVQKSQSAIIWVHVGFVIGVHGINFWRNMQKSEICQGLFLKYLHFCLHDTSVLEKLK